ncbi:hypothetical protein [Bosea sp. BH3]|uniref:hypothetical protein n=1 Tax=Bosea sp. BH3 TaxID=2871701 RepID=UPI0021CB7708|nr:hypothetical protein [Bosea sp. BH3]MCU4180176.1 hypothetical protein [Bosea sp. BH3]
MSIATRVHDAVEASRAVADLGIGEDPGRLSLAGSLTRAALDAWQAVSDEAPDWLSFSFIDPADDRILPRDAIAGERARITITFASNANMPHLFTREGWRSFLLEDARVSSATSVRLAFDAARFRTRAFDVAPWEGVLAVGLAAPPPRDSSPRRQVRSQSSVLMAPTRIEPWLVDGDNSQGTAWEIWEDVASAMISRSLPNELYVEAGEERVSLVGQPPRRLELGRFSDGDVPFTALQDAACWVYTEGTDVEVRHTFLSAELAREWPARKSFSSGLSGKLASSLDSARLLYKAHLRAGSKDTLKALADLRKTLADDVQKLVQQARDLSSAVWRDVAVAIGVMAVRFGLDAAKTVPSSFAFSTIYLLVAAYFIASFWLTVTINRRFLSSLEQSRAAWRTKLYAFLDDDDYRELAGTPLSAAIEDYRVTERRARRVVSIVVLLLVLATLVEAGYVDPSLVMTWTGAKLVQIWEAGCALLRSLAVV